MTANTVRMEGPNIGHSSGHCLHTASCNQSSEGLDRGGPKLNSFFSFIAVGATLEVRLRPF